MDHSHYTGPRQGLGPGNDGFLYYNMYYTLHRDRDRYKEPLFSTVPFPVPVPVPVRVTCSVNETLGFNAGKDNKRLYFTLSWLVLAIHWGKLGCVGGYKILN